MPKGKKKSANKAAKPKQGSGSVRVPGKKLSSTAEKEVGEFRGGTSYGPSGAMYKAFTAPTNVGVQIRQAPAHACRLTTRFFYGWVTAGNGTFGASGAVYHEVLGLAGTGGYLVLGASPLRPADVTNTYSPGVTYMRDIMNHFSRVRWRSIRLCYVPLANTAQGGIVVICPFAAGSTYAVTSVAAANLSFAGVSGSQGAVSSPFWAPFEVDFTKFIIDRQTFIEADSPGIGQSVPSALQTQPLSFCVSGSPGNTTGRVGLLYFDVDVDLIDFAGITTTPATLSTAAASAPPSSGSVKLVNSQTEVPSAASVALGRDEKSRPVYCVTCGKVPCSTSSSRCTGCLSRPERDDRTDSSSLIDGYVPVASRPVPIPSRVSTQAPGGDRRA